MTKPLAVITYNFLQFQKSDMVPFLISAKQLKESDSLFQLSCSLHQEQISKQSHQDLECMGSC